MREIKFRGRVPDSDEIYGGQIVYGFYVEFAEEFQGSRHWIMPINDRRGYPVEPESVRQIVGCDINGREVYEGDTLIGEEGEEHIAEIYDRPSKIRDLKIKEA